MDGDDVRMVESGGGQGLSFEAVDAILVRREAGGEEFERYLAVQARVLCQVDLSHPARAECVKDFIRADGLTGEEFRSVFDHERADSPDSGFFIRLPVFSREKTPPSLRSASSPEPSRRSLQHGLKDTVNMLPALPIHHIILCFQKNRNLRE